MKNIILIDVSGNYVETLLDIDDVNIKMFVIDQWLFEIFKDKYHNKLDKIENFYHRSMNTNQEFEELHNTDYNLTYEDIEAYRSTQLKCEHYLHREILDDSVIQYRYYLALKFWLGFFAKNKIDMVITCHLEHGGLWDSIIIDIAKNKNIPVISISNVIAAHNFDMYCITNLTDKTFLDVSNLKLNNIDFKTLLKSIKNKYEFVDKDKILYSNFNLFKQLKHYRKSIKNAIQYYSKKYFVSFYKKYKENKSRFIFLHNISKEEVYEQSQYVNKMEKIYRQISHKPNYKEKYIYYPLHQEPEATIMVRTTMSSQLFIIEQISKMLPPNWKLYVKEHPTQFSAYKQTSFFLKNIQCFHSVYFYGHIESLPNVMLIDVDTDGRELMLNSQGICSICGTSLFEGVTIKKPILIWGKNSTFLELLQDSFVIHSTSELKNAIDKLMNGFKPEYGDIENIYRKYIFKQTPYDVSVFKKSSNELFKIMNYILKEIKEQ